MNYILKDLLSHFDIDVFTSKEYICFTIFILVFVIYMMIFLSVSLNEKLTMTLLFLYMYIVFSMTVLMRIDNEEDNVIRMIPFFTYINYKRFGSTITFWLGLLNIIMFIPIGYLLDKVTSHKHSHMLLTLKVLFIAFFSMIIEVLQYLFKAGVCEFDDVLMNIIGGIIGIIINTIISRISNKSLYIKRF